VVSVEVQGDATGTGLTMRTGQPLSSVRPASAVQGIGTVRAGPDGDWILEPLNGVSYAHQAIDRYECDIGAVDQTGFDPTKDDGGVPRTPCQANEQITCALRPLASRPAATS